MTLAISVEFLHGVFRADPSGAASTGRAAAAEWPPSPSRLFAALVAADGTGPRCRVTDGSELEWLEGLPAPVIHANGAPGCVHQRLLPRFVVLAKAGADGTRHQEYVARKTVLARPGARVAPRDPRVTYFWKPPAAPPAGVLDALRLRCARVGYLGTADSPVRLRQSSEAPSDAVSEVFVPAAADGDADECVAINVPAPGDVELLDMLYETWRERGPSVTRAQFPALQHEAWYLPPSVSARSSKSERSEVVAWLRLGENLRPGARRTAAVSGRRVSVLTALFKAAVLSRYDELFGTPPGVLHGHGFESEGYDLARYLALPDVGFRWSDGRIHGLALWMPAESTSVERQRARDAAHAVRRLVGGGVDAAVWVRGPERRPVSASPQRWCGPSRRWATAFPAVHERHGPVSLAEVTRWCRHAGLPEPTACRAARTPLARGGVDLAPPEVHRLGRRRMPYSHLELVFAEPVRGPVVVGAARQRGLGLCLPLDRKGA